MKVRYDPQAGRPGRLAELRHLAGGISRVLWWRLIGRQPDFGPLNGQRSRTSAVVALLELFRPVTVVETGTYLATTTGFLADRGLPTFSVEVAPMYVGIARARLRSRDNVTLLVGDSSGWLAILAREGQLDRPLVYLDAHAPEQPLPLDCELAAIRGAAEHAVLVVDDCLVPHDNGYGYDVYGDLPISLERVNVPRGSRSAYPATPAAEETGGRRGTLYVGWGDGAQAIEQLVQRGMLRLAADRPAAAAGDAGAPGPSDPPIAGPGPTPT